MNYLIPANTKKSALIFNMFRPIDLIILGSGAGLTFILLFILKENTALMLIIKLFPLVITALLVTPIQNYHNTLVFITEIYDFYSSRRIYTWKGWCVRSEYNSEQKN
ncbi:MAG: hypothetical protein RR228_01635 [Bacilli bacterium]|uniref:hypothetical protein n=1 Tax=Clostridium sp. TaxID=1506 RepID=UPI002FC6A65D